MNHHAVVLVDRLFGPTAIERRARMEIDALLDAGWSVTAITARWADDDHTSLRARPELELVEVPRRGTRSVTMALALARGTAREVRVAWRPSTRLLVSHGSVSLVAVIPSARRRGVPTVFVVHSLVQDRIRTGANPHPLPSTLLYRATDRIAARWSTCVIGVSRYIVNVAIGLGSRASSAEVLHNPIDRTRFRPPDAGTTRDLDVVFIGRLTVDKGIDDLLAAAEILGPSAGVEVIGSGGRRRDLEARVSRGRVRFHGRVPNEELPGLLGRARVAVVPSRNEPQGVAVLEALACGVPVVATNVGGIPEMVVDGENGWLAAPASPEALARALAHALADPRLESRRDVARASTEAFDTDEFRRRAVALYEGVVSAADGG